MKKSALFFSAVSAAVLLTSCGEKSTGEKAGVVTKLAQSGIFCKTWEGQIIRGGLNSGSGAMGAPFDFTVEDLSLLPKIKDALENQKEIKIMYREEMVTFCRSESSDHFLTSVDVIDHTPAKPPESKMTEDIGSANSTAALLRVIAEQNAKILEIAGAAK